MIDTQYTIPSAPLVPYVDRYWSWTSSGSAPELPEILPGMGVELLFHFNDPFTIEFSCGERKGSASSQLICSRSRTGIPRVSGAAGFISIRFKCGAFRHFCPVAMEDLNDTVQSAEDLWGREGGIWEERISGSGTFFERVMIIEEVLMVLLRKYCKERKELDYAINRIYYSHQNMKIEDLAEEIGYSRGHFYRAFNAAMGMSPKFTQRLSCFQSTLKELLLVQQSQYLSCCLDHGYYDQSHFVKDFQFFLGYAPSEFLIEKNFKLHFYNTSLSHSVSLP